MAQMTPQSAFAEILAEDQLEDRREYDAGMLAGMYDLSNEDAAILYAMIQKEFEV